MLGKYEELKGARAAIYKRKSQEDDERQVLSIGKQDAICRDCVAEYQFQTSPEWDFEEMKSAKVAGVRPEFARMIQLVHDGVVDVTVAWHFSRYVRNMQEGGLLIDLLHTGRLKAIVTKDKIFFPDDNTIIVAIEAASATEYSRDLSRSVIAGIDRKAQLHLPHGRAPLGYVNNMHKRQGERDWSDDVDRLPLLQQVFQRLLTGSESARSVWKWAISDLQLTTPSRRKIGGGNLPLSSFYRLLRRTEYAGFFYRNGEKIALAGITPIINEDQYWKIQDLLGRKGVARPKHQTATYSHYLVSPEGEYFGADRTFRVTCDCGHKFSGRTKKECPACGTPLDNLQHPKYYSLIHYYNVPKRKRGERCKYINEKSIDSFVINYAEAYLSLPKPYQEWSLQYLQELKDREYQQHRDREKRQDDHFRSLEQQKENAKRALLNGAFSPGEYRDALREINEKGSKAQEAQSSGKWFEKGGALVSLADNIIDTWKNGSTADKRAVLADMGSNILWKGEKLDFKHPKWLDAFVTGLKDAKREEQWFEPDENGDTSSGYKAKLESEGNFGPAFPILCGMWDDVRTLLLEDETSPNDQKPNND